MSVPRGRYRLNYLVAGLLLGILVAALPAASSEPQGSSVNVALAQKLRVPYFTPKNLNVRLRQVLARRGDIGRDGSGGARGAAGVVFNDDGTGLPQNEESVTACKSNSRYVLEGTNDYRGLLDPEGNFTGWHFSTNSGRSLTNEGLLPSVALLSDGTMQVPSGGDPVDVAAGGCAMYAASLAYDPVDPFSNPNGVAVYKSDPATLASCDTSNPSNPACWPVRRLVAEGTGNAAPAPDNPSHFLDKEWMDVGRSGDAEYVWVTYSDFVQTGLGELDFTAEIFAVRCDTSLTDCTAPIPISEDDFDVQFSDVTIAPDGRVYVTWSEIIGEVPNDPDCPNPLADGTCPQQTFVHKLRVAQPGSTTFGPEKVVYVEERAIPFGGFLHSNDLRIATYPKNDVAIVNGQPRVFVVWDACLVRPLAFICEEAEVKLSWSDDFGDTWTDPMVISKGGDNYFPSIVSNDARKPRLAFTWFSSRRDRQFHNRQDIEFLSMNPALPRASGVRRLTGGMNEPEADPILGGSFIGDYIEVAAVGNRAWVGYNANYRQENLLGLGVPVAQQDNYLTRTSLGGRND